MIEEIVFKTQPAEATVAHAEAKGEASKRQKMLRTAEVDLKLFLATAARRIFLR